MPISWRQKVQIRRQEFISQGGNYRRMQGIAYALSQEMRRMGMRTMPVRWKDLFHRTGDYPSKVLDTVKRAAVHWPELSAARMSDHNRVSDVILAELIHLKDGFCAELVRECEVPEGRYAFEISGMIMTDWLRAFGDLVLIYLNDESQFVYEVK